ncbi:MAG: hypothetical protein ACOC1O_06385 [bacterium]
MVKHILRYGTNADKKFIDQNNQYYDLLAINGNMVAYTPGALAGFIRNNLLNESEKGFFIDPITHSFQHRLDKIKSYSKKEKKKTLKKSIENLIDYYGEPLILKIKEPENSNDEEEKGRPVKPEDFRDHKEEFCKNVIEFQLDVIKKKNNEKGFLKYFEGSEEQLTDFEPDFVTPPYFYLNELTYKEWLKLNIDFAKIAKDEYQDKEIYVQLVVSDDIFISTEMRNDIIKKYSSLDIEGVLIWIDDFNEHQASQSKLKIYLKLVKELNDNGLKILNLYGSFFSIILTSLADQLGFSLAGVGHGMEYGEHRAVVPVGGGIPSSKYYFYPLHKRLKFEIAQELIKSYIIDKSSGNKKEAAKLYYDEICDCQKCKNIIGNNIDNFFEFQSTEFYEYEVKGVKRQRSYADQETKANCLIHYLESKVNEFDSVKELKLDSLCEILEWNYNTYSDYDNQNQEALGYLIKWKRVLESGLNEDD